MCDSRSRSRSSTVVWMMVQRSDPEPPSPKGRGGIALPAPTAPRRLPLASRPVASRSVRILRTRVLAQASPGRTCRLFVCHAPAGFGKTTFVGQWCARDQRPGSWLTLREADNDPVLFLKHLWSALEHLEKLGPHHGQDLESLYQQVDAAAARLLDRFGHHTPMQLIVDEIERSTEPTALRCSIPWSKRCPTGRNS